MKRDRVIDKKDSSITSLDNPISSTLVGFYSAIFTTIITVVTFAFAITAVPNSGVNCIGKTKGCFQYPYLDSLSEFPQDYVWMIFAIMMIFSYVIIMASLHVYASVQKKVFSQIGLSFAIIAALILFIAYFIQLSVVPSSLISGETEGIALLTQYNPHGMFIALEELGYLMMSVSFLCIAPVFSNKNRLEASIRWIFIINFALVVVSFATFLINDGLNRLDRFEIVALPVNWIVLIINGVLLSILFGKQIKAFRRRRI